MTKSKNINETPITKVVRKEQFFKTNTTFTSEDVLASIGKHPIAGFLRAYENHMMKICEQIIHDIP